MKLDKLDSLKRCFNLIDQITNHLEGCSSSHCVVNGPHGNMSAGNCKCVQNASRFQIITMETKIKSLQHLINSEINQKIND